MKDHPDMKDYNSTDLVMSSFLATQLVNLLAVENLTLNSMVERHKAEVRNGNLSFPMFAAMKFFEAAPKTSIVFLTMHAIYTYEANLDSLPRKFPWTAEIYENEHNDFVLSLT